MLSFGCEFFEIQVEICFSRSNLQVESHNNLHFIAIAIRFLNMDGQKRFLFFLFMKNIPPKIFSLLFATDMYGMQKKSKNPRMIYSHIQLRRPPSERFPSASLGWLRRV